MHERTVGRACSQNEQHQLGQGNIGMDTQRIKTSKRETKKRWRENIEEVDSSQWMRVKIWKEVLTGVKDVMESAGQ